MGKRNCNMGIYIKQIVKNLPKQLEYIFTFYNLKYRKCAYYVHYMEALTHEYMKWSPIVLLKVILLIVIL